ncbi:hypothetical protein IFM89_007639 [Coptis chinensis]|uniref:Uncharacterized protein n=1 Tax=Coptis chinensis TaxID=261450 RepID=A0A835HUG1_9MAGN|nr:hypothetical protein IFM89_007639 [Coptis chinensis]
MPWVRRVLAVRAFGVLLKTQNSLRKLYLMNDGISEEAARGISVVVNRSPALEDFCCSTMRKWALKELPSLRHLNISYCDPSYLNLEDDGILAIANALNVSAHHLKYWSLEITGNEITDEAVLL